MSKKLSIIVAVVVILAFTAVAIYSQERADKIDYSLERQKALDEVSNRPNITVNTKHQYKDGRHIYLGYLEVPSPCYSHNVEIKKSEEITEIAITYQEDPSAKSENCIQMITEKTFKVSFEGAEDEDIIATLNGETVNLNQFEIDPDEDIEEADIFIKG
ncbi:MAG TPA: hypothetical protein P5328_00835 [Candidatus Paceibacterota bacterium]|nr:hypothetical protein [Candidatus Paceibacterota bacterium]HRZ34535.1 hypothetical protein [Candidatus Paceibacterota bacterium]